MITHETRLQDGKVILQLYGADGQGLAWISFDETQIKGLDTMIENLMTARAMQFGPKIIVPGHHTIPRKQ